MSNDTDDELDKQIVFKMKYDRIMREAELRENGGLRPRVEIPDSRSTYPSRLARTLLTRTLMRGFHIRP